MGLMLNVSAMVKRTLRRIRFAAVPLRFSCRTVMDVALADKAGVFGFILNLDRSENRVGPAFDYFYSWKHLDQTREGEIDHDTH